MKRIHFLLATVISVPVLTAAVGFGLYRQQLVQVGRLVRQEVREWRKAKAYPSERQKTRLAIQGRPTDLWPRSSGHVLLACPGSVENAKGYHEPGGSFSPAVGSFGVAVWLLDDAGRVSLTSDSVPVEAVSQRFQIDGVQSYWRPTVDTQTPQYRVTWSQDCSGVSHGSLHLAEAAAAQRVLAIRSVGPAGGPIERLRVKDGVLWVNERWKLTATPTPKIRLGIEPDGANDGSWRAPLAPSDAEVNSPSGWGYALLSWSDKADVELDVVDGWPTPVQELEQAPDDMAVEMDGGSPAFRASLQAQIAHLMSSLVGVEARPGEPTNYPLAWLRDGAYVAAALERAGMHGVASKLIEPLAKRDFFGGFGTEGDAPGLSLWVIGDVWDSASPKQRASLWPHVFRKAEIIRSMAMTKVPIRVEPVGPIVPEHRWNREADILCDPAESGLIMGRMDWGRPALYITAHSYRGLQNAARIAAEQGEGAKAAEWHALAEQLREAWGTQLPGIHGVQERTTISGMHPTWIGLGHEEAFAERLSQQYAGYLEHPEQPTPPWSYFEVAKAHQWLLLGKQEKAWEYLNYFFASQASPGLFSWSEGSGEENSFGRWEHIRGWLEPKAVTPHYWTAAEMLLFQLDMLAYAIPDGALARPTWKLGEGVTPEWLKSPISVRNLRTWAGTASWKWDGQRMSVWITGREGAVELGSAFPKGTPVEVHWLRRGESAAESG